VEQALLELRARCPFRESEGCMAELPWNVFELPAHITEMRYGEGPGSSSSNVTQTQPFYQPTHLPNPSPPTTVHHQRTHVLPQETLNTTPRNDLGSKPTYRSSVFIPIKLYSEKRTKSALESGVGVGDLQEGLREIKGGICKIARQMINSGSSGVKPRRARVEEITRARAQD
jgi:hypothetical protein